jgi:hypothetical protein
MGVQLRREDLDALRGKLQKGARLFGKRKKDMFGTFAVQSATQYPVSGNRCIRGGNAMTSE